MLAPDEARPRPPDDLAAELTGARAELTVARAELTVARAELTVARAELDLARAELDRARAALVTRNADVALVLRAAGHDLKSPLKTLTGFIEMVAAEHDSPLLQASRELAADLAALCETLVEYAEIGGHAPEFEHQPLRPIVERVLDTLLLDISDRGARIDGSHPDVDVHADHKLLELSICHLIDNALTHAGAHKPPRVVIETHAAPDGRITIAVEDDGPGVPATERARVFDPLVRLREGAAPPGHGLGLAKVKRACEVMGAAVALVDPVTLGGCRVEITLRPPPEAPPREAPPPDAPPHDAPPPDAAPPDD